SIFASIRLRFTACCAKDEYRASASAVRGDSAARRSKYGSTGQPLQSTKNPCPRANPKAARHESSRQTILRAPAFLSSSAKSSGHAPLGLTKGKRTARRGLQRKRKLGKSQTFSGSRVLRPLSRHLWRWRVLRESAPRRPRDDRGGNRGCARRARRRMRQWRLSREVCCGARKSPGDRRRLVNRHANVRAQSSRREMPAALRGRVTTAVQAGVVRFNFR